MEFLKCSVHVIRESNATKTRKIPFNYLIA